MTIILRSEKIQTRFAAWARRATRARVRPAAAPAALAYALAGVLVIGLSAPSRAQPIQVPPAARSFHLGDLQLWALRDAQNRLDNDGTVLGVEAGPAAVSSVLKRAGAPTDKVTLDIDALLVLGPRQVMLFDTGLGPGVHGALAASLSQAGVSAGDVTDVFITHSHFDHVGGLATGDGHLSFPHAIIHLSVKEWAWMQNQASSHDLASLIAPQVRTFKPGEVIAPGVTAIGLYGHTPGHVGYEFRSRGMRLLDIGDVAHSTIVSLGMPEWAIEYDNDRQLGESTRRKTLARLAARQEWVFAPHFPFPGVGKIQARGRGYIWVPGLP